MGLYPEKNYFYSKLFKNEFMNWYMVYEPGYTCQQITMKQLKYAQRLINKWKISACVYGILIFHEFPSTQLEKTL